LGRIASSLAIALVMAICIVLMPRGKDRGDDSLAA
jgi:hypothetical protein